MAGDGPVRSGTVVGFQEDDTDFTPPRKRPGVSMAGPRSAPSSTQGGVCGSPGNAVRALDIDRKNPLSHLVRLGRAGRYEDQWALCVGTSPLAGRGPGTGGGRGACAKSGMGPG